MVATRRAEEKPAKTAVPPPDAVNLIVEAARSKSAVDIVVLDVRAATDVADFFMICSAQADVHARAIVDAVRDALEPIGRKAWHVEGVESLTWVLVDFVDVVVHVFRDDARHFYALEEMWADAVRVPLPEEQTG